MTMPKGWFAAHIIFAAGEATCWWVGFGHCMSENTQTALSFAFGALVFSRARHGLVFLRAENPGPEATRERLER